MNQEFNISQHNVLGVVCDDTFQFLLVVFIYRRERKSLPGRSNLNSLPTRCGSWGKKVKFTRLSRPEVLPKIVVSGK